MAHWKNAENYVALIDANRIYYLLERERIHFLLIDETGAKG